MAGRLATFLIAAFSVCLFILSACAGAPPAASPDATPTVPLVKVKVQVQPIMTYAPFYIARDEGYYKEQGLEVEFLSLGTAQQSTPALITGQVDVISGPVTAGMLNAMSQGEPVRFVADKGNLDTSAGCAPSAFVVRRAIADAGVLSNAAEVKGMKISTTSGNYISFMWELVLSDVNLTLADMKTNKLSEAEEIAALENGSLDMAVMSEPWLTQTLKGGKIAVWKTSPQVLPNATLGVVVFGPNLLRGDPDVGRRFMTAYLKAVRQYSEGKTDRNLKILSEFTKLSPEQLKEICWPPFKRDGSIDVTSITRFQEWAVKNKFLDTVTPPEKFWDGHFVEQANQALKSNP
jgi:NitT/TauT family transport system substrate-binding protein